jgi:ABC-type multidrug transport system fused ATPase/permease subunit
MREQGVLSQQRSNARKAGFTGMTDWFRAFGQMIRFCMAPRKAALFGVLALVLVSNCTELLWPELLKLYIDSYGEGPFLVFGFDASGLATERGRLLWLPLALIAAAGLRWLTNFSSIVAQGALAQDILVGLRACIYQRLQNETFSYHDRVHSGSLITNLVEDVRFSTVFFSNAFFAFIEACCFMLLAWAMLWRAFPASGFVVMGCMVSALLIASFLFRRNLPRFIATRLATADMVRQFNENVEGRLLIQAYGKNRQVSEQWRRLVTTVQDRAINEVWWQIVLHQVVMWGTLLSTFGAVAAYLIVSRHHGTPISNGILVYMISILIIHLQRVRQFLGSTDNTMRFMVTAIRLRDFLGPDLTAPAAPQPADPFIFQSLEFRKVSFSYVDDRPVLHDVSFCIDGPGMLGIAGLTGAGKSTVVQLAAGLYSPDSGQILLNGVCLSEWEPSQLRHAAALVFQDVFLFSGSVRENVAFGLDDWDDERIDAAVVDAEAIEFIRELPDGIETAIGEKGVSLSGGQRQRLSLARALARCPGLLILDSCTSALDTETESKVLANIKERADSSLTMVISHRPAALERADRVLILEAGRVLAFAAPAELAAARDPAWLRATLADDSEPRGLPHA